MLDSASLNNDGLSSASSNGGGGAPLADESKLTMIPLQSFPLSDATVIAVESAPALAASVEKASPAASAPVKSGGATGKAPAAADSDNSNNDNFDDDDDDGTSFDDSMIPAPQQSYNTVYEVERMVANLGVHKAHLEWHKSCYMGLLAGLFVAFGGFLALIVSGGLSVDLRTAQPMLPKLLTGLTFPYALYLIVLFGGELFTGNVMVLVVAAMNGKVSMFEVIRNWVLIFIFNFIGCVVSAYLFGYVADIYSSEPYLSYLRGIVEHKCQLPFHVAFLRGIPANALVCLGVFMGLSARQVSGKIMGMFFPVFGFAAVGYEHCIANMFYISLGMFYGANCTVVQFLFYNVLPVALGNMVGGGLMIGASEVYLYHWGMHAPVHKKHLSLSGLKKVFKADSRKTK